MSLDEAGRKKEVHFSKESPKVDTAPSTASTDTVDSSDNDSPPHVRHAKKNEKEKGEAAALKHHQEPIEMPTSPAPQAEDKKGKKNEAKQQDDKKSHKTEISPAEIEGSILRRSTQEMSPRFVKCDDCGENIPIADWPNHRDRLRKVTVRQRTRTFIEKYILVPFVDFVMLFLVNIWFREVAVVGENNIPASGPVVFYANHQNQFIDAMVLRAHAKRPLRYIIAEKSMHRPIIGHFARLMNAVPVVRPQDVPTTPGTGMLKAMPDAPDGGRNRIVGEKTKFSELKQGDVINWISATGQKCQGQVHVVVNDEDILLTQPILEEGQITKPTTFKFSRRIDQSEMYAEVYSTLEQGHAIGIFPEGGSHDRTSLQPLKAGVALFTLGAAERGIHAKMIPVGLTYFYGHRFRSRVHVEFGKPINAPPDLVELFPRDKRKATGELLTTLQAQLKAVTINVSDWSTLKFLHSFRRLYQPPEFCLETRDYLRLTRRLAILIHDLEDDPEFMDFRTKVENYMDYCNALLIRDAQAATLANLKGNTISMGLLVRRLMLLFIMGIILIPFAVVGSPIGVVVHILSEDHAQTALSASTVKVVGADVKASFKLVTCFALIPTVFSCISAVVWWMSDLRTATTVWLSLPMMMYVSLLIGQEFILEFRAALPLLMSIMSKHKQFLKLHDRRSKLVALANQIVEKHDPDLGPELEKLYKVPEPADTTARREASLFSLRHGSHRINATKHHLKTA